MSERPVALVTGAASGIGLALAEELASRGYDLTLLDLDPSALAQAERRLSANGTRLLVRQLDVTDAKAQAAAFAAHMERFGRLDLAVLNAGIGEREDFLLADPSSKEYERTLDVDLTAAIAGVRLAAHAMGVAAEGGKGGSGRGGCIVAIASAAGVFPVPVSPIYAAAKGGLLHFMRSLAPRLAARNIAAAAICPQYVDTPLVSNMLRNRPEVAKAMMGPLWGQPLLKPSQVVELILGIVESHAAAGAAAAAGGGAVAGGGSGQCVHLLLQNGRVVDPFAPRPRRGGNSGNVNSSSSGGSGKPETAAAAAALARFSPEALRCFAAQPLPRRSRRVTVERLSVDFRAATRVVDSVTPGLTGQLPPGAVLVRRLFAGVNASDINYTSGRYHGSAGAAQRALPYDAGFESVGVVVATAPDVKGLPPGTPVATMEAGFSEFGVAPANRCLRVPAPTPEVLALLTSGLTASIALEQSAGLPLPPPFPQTAGQTAGQTSKPPPPQKTVFVTAAAGGTGMFAVQLAKLAGCRVVATCGGPEKAALLRRLGADRIIDYRSEDVKAVLKAECPKGVDIVYESVGGKMFDIAVDALADRGTLVVIGMMSAYGSGWKPSSHEGLAEKLLWKSARVCGFFLLRYAPLWGPHLSALVELVRQGRLSVTLDASSFVGVDRAADAVDRLQSGQSSGKVVLQVATELPEQMTPAKL